MAENGHNHAGMWVFPKAEEITADLAAKTMSMPRPFVLVMLGAVVLAIIFIATGVANRITGAFVEGVMRNKTRVRPGRAAEAHQDATNLHSHDTTPFLFRAAPVA